MCRRVRRLTDPRSGHQPASPARANGRIAPRHIVVQWLIQHTAPSYGRGVFYKKNR
jgi:hypothetical protein